MNLGVKTMKESTQLYSADKVEGTVEEVLKAFKESTGVKDCEMIYKADENFANTGSMMMFIIAEVNDKKEEGDLFTSDDIFLSRKMSDQIRTGELNFSALLDFVVVHHTNNTDGSEYPLMVRPSQVQNRDNARKFSISLKSKQTKKYQPKTANVKSVLANANF